MSAPTIVVQIGFAANPLDVSVTWTDVSTYVRSAQIQRGRQNDLDRIEAGSATIVLKNVDARFDANNTAGPYTGQVLPLRRLQILARHYDRAGTLTAENYIFTGTIDSWHTDYRDTQVAWTTIRGTDNYKLLSLMKLTGTFGQELSSSRVNDVLSAVGWQSPRTWVLNQSKLGNSTTDTASNLTWVGPAAAAFVQTGYSSVQAATISSKSVLDHLSQVAQAENGSLYVNAGGDLVFEARHAPYAVHDRYKLCFADNSSVADDGATLSTRAIGYRAIMTDMDEAQLWNQVSVTPSGSTTTQTANDTASQTKYFTRTLDRSGSLVTDSTEALNNATWLLNRYSTPWYHVPSIEVNLNGHDDTASNNVLDPDVILALDIFDKVNLRWQPPGASTRYELPSFIDAVTDIIPAPGQWVRQFALQSADKFTGWVLDSTVNSVLGRTSKVVAY